MIAQDRQSWAAMEPKRKRSILLASLVVLLVAAGAFALYTSWPAYEDAAQRFLAWVEAQGAWAPVVFTAAVATAVVIVLPGVAFSLAAGFLFGWFAGVACMWIGTVGGAMIAFLLGSTVLGQRFMRYAEKHTRFDVVNKALRHKGWKIIALTRVVPFFPFKLSNYVFGAAGFSFRDFFIGSAIGTLPIMSFNVYIGSVANDLTALGEDKPSGPLYWAINIGGIVAFGLATYYVVRLARNALNRTLDHSPDNSTET
jgi:uncharacterized membrane protein YdjX (TVP38/TMEM64 family)